MTFQTNDKKDNNRDLKNKKDLKNEIRPVWQGRQDLNLRHLVLETSALPTELRPYNVDNG